MLTVLCRDEDLPFLVVYDTEHAPGYTNTGAQEDRLTEIGLVVISVAEVRSLMSDRLSFKAAYFTPLHRTHLRVLEHGRWQILRPLDSKGDFPWQAAYSEFGTSHWIHLKDVTKHIVDAIKELGRIKSKTSKKAKIIIVGHAVGNDEAELKKVGFRWHRYFEVIDTVDTQILGWPSTATDHPPALLHLMQKKQIDNVRRHHGANDAVYTAAVFGGLVLDQAKTEALLEVPENQAFEVGAEVDKLRANHYYESTTRFLGQETACNMCGSQTHTQLECNRRCLYCNERRLKNVFHNYHNCPARQQSGRNPAQDISASRDLGRSTLVKLADTEKLFVMTARKVFGRKTRKMHQTSRGFPAVSAPSRVPDATK